MELLKFIALENYLSDLLGVKVDLVEKQALNPAIGRHVTERPFLSCTHLQLDLARRDWPCQNPGKL